jgi:two-component system chemotaxis sensor kinase CheA
MDLSAYQSIYITEARQHLRVLRQALARLEAGVIEPHELEEVYRAAHSLKGDSATMDYDALASLAYALEIPLKQAMQTGHSLPPDFALTLRTTIERLEAAVEAMDSPAPRE